MIHPFNFYVNVMEQYISPEDLMELTQLGDEKKLYATQSPKYDVKMGIVVANSPEEAEHIVKIRALDEIIVGVLQLFKLDGSISG